MQTIDWILVVLLLLGAIRGWRTGLIKQVVSLGGLIAGLLIAKLCYAMVGDAIAPHIDNHTTLAHVLAFILIWIAVPVILGVLGEILTTVLDKLFVLGTVNSILGALLGLIKFQLIIGALIWVLCATKIIGENTMQQSVLCAPLKAVPEALYTAMTENGRQE
ncbi:MAG: CvpA family protein [Bacteroidaceae bacterium]|nr:CvpA family protein [Bacteroidaceae bacterium]MBR2945368.1 CvpA family protein [Bacteroidaceae bacterium]